MLTTHFMDEAERCDRVGILHQGRLVRIGPPEELKAAVGGDVVVIHPNDTLALQGRIRERFGADLRPSRQAASSSLSMSAPRMASRLRVIRSTGQSHHAILSRRATVRLSKRIFTTLAGFPATIA